MTTHTALSSTAEGLRAQLLDMLRAEAVLRGRFVLSSGDESDVYIDARRVTLSGDGSHLVGEIFNRMMRSAPPDAVAGMSLGADPIVTATTLVSSHHGFPIDGLLVRKQAKEHGAARRIEGPLRAGMTAIVVEDTSTTGASALEAVEALREAGVRVERVISLIDRDEGAAAAIRAAGLTFNAVFRIGELLDQPSSSMPPNDSQKHQSTRLVLKADGSSVGNPGHAGAGYQILDESGTEVTRGASYLGRTSNNVAEYRALLLGLDAAKALGAREVSVQMDSELVVRQLKGTYKVRNSSLADLFEKVQGRLKSFRTVDFKHIPRDENAVADKLATTASATKGR